MVNDNKKSMKDIRKEAEKELDEEYGKKIKKLIKEKVEEVRKAKKVWTQKEAELDDLLDEAEKGDVDVSGIELED